MPLNLEDKKALVHGSERGCGESPIRRRCRIPRHHGVADDRAACQGARAGRVHACRQEHAGTQGPRRHVVRVDRTEAERTARARFLEGRSGRRRARGEGLREDATTSSCRPSCPSAGRCCPARISRRSRACRRGSRRCPSSSGVLKAPDREAGAHPRRAAGQARPHHRRRTRPETGRRRLNRH